MKLDRVDVSIQTLKSKNNVNLEDILQFFIDLCKDVMDNYEKSVDALPIENNDVVVGNLRSCGMLLTMIGDGHPELFSPEQDDALKKTIDELQDQKKKIDESRVKKSKTLFGQMNDYLTINEYLAQSIADLKNKMDLNKKELDDLVINHLQI